MATHKITLILDGDALSVSHRTTVTVAGIPVSHSEPVELDDPAAVKASLTALINGNRAEMERRTTELAIQHVAAVSGKTKKGTKSLRAGGTLGAVGTADTKKAE